MKKADEDYIPVERDRHETTAIIKNVNGKKNIEQGMGNWSAGVGVGCRF